MINKDLHSKIEAAGFRIKTFRVGHLEEIKAEFKGLVEEGLLDENFYNNNLRNFNYDYEDVLPNAKSVIVVALPQCKSIIEFKHEGKSFEVVIPPTYIYPDIDNRVINILNNVLGGNGYSFARPRLPLKLLAVRSSLGEYGRNNICYVSGLGSFIRLAAFITDCEFVEDSWGEMKVMESCSKCSICADNCPTGAINKGRFLIHAHNCITNFNEYDAPIPEWINSSWHNSIVGCMKCQDFCPHNKILIDSIDERIYFNEEETKQILDESAFTSLPLETRNKITNIGMEDYLNVLPRNIRLLMDRK